MDLIENYTLTAKRNPWELFRFDFFWRQIQSIISHQQNVTILDVGSGDAWFAAQLCKKHGVSSSITCWDKEYDKEQYQEIQKISGLKYTSKQPNEKFDIILMLDVLEHVEHDELFLKNILDKNLKPNGTLLISVPAWPFLFGEHDRKLKHFRRYSPYSIKKLIQKSDSKIIKKGGLFSSLLFYRILENWVSKAYNNKPFTYLTRFSENTIATSIIKFIFNVDARISYFLSTIKIDCLGLSWWAICKKNDNKFVN